MRRLSVTAAATLVVAGLAVGPATAEPGRGQGKGLDKERVPTLVLEPQVSRVGVVMSFQCTATVEHATAVGVSVDLCQAFRDGLLVAESAPARSNTNTASSTRWTGVVPLGGRITVCRAAIAKLTTGEFLTQYVCN